MKLAGIVYPLVALLSIAGCGKDTPIVKTGHAEVAGKPQNGSTSNLQTTAQHFTTKDIEVEKFDIVGGMGGESDYPCLFFQARSADVILVGKVDRLLRQGLVPWDLPEEKLATDAEWRTTWSIQVEQVLKGAALPSQVKVSEEGGILNGWGTFAENSPRLVPGKRYILFLKTVLPRDRAYGFQARLIDGKAYNNGDLDELLLFGGSCNKLLLEGGEVTTPYDAYQTGKLRPYYDRNAVQIAGAREADAVAEIKRSVLDGDYGAWVRRMRRQQ